MTHLPHQQIKGLAKFTNRTKYHNCTHSHVHGHTPFFPLSNIPKALSWTFCFSLLQTPMMYPHLEIYNKNISRQQPKVLKINEWHKWEVQTCKAYSALKSLTLGHFLCTYFDSLLPINSCHRTNCVFLYQKTGIQS